MFPVPEQTHFIYNAMQHGTGKHRNKFIPEEDERLKALVMQYGDSWNIISSMMRTKSARQCRERYKNYLSPELCNRPWTPEEESLLAEKYEEFGAHWAKMVAFFPGRSDVNLKNHWSAMLNRRSKEERLKRLEHAQTSDASPVQVESMGKFVLNEDDYFDGLDDFLSSSLIHE